MSGNLRELEEQLKGITEKELRREIEWAETRGKYIELPLPASDELEQILERVEEERLASKSE